MKNRIISITDPKISLNILSDEDINKIHEATMYVIENVGIRFPSDTALSLFVDNGAQVDRETFTVRIPRDIVEHYISLAPSSYPLAAVDADLDLYLDGNHSYLGTDGCGVEIIDLFSNEKRRTIKQDLIEIACVADALPQIAFHWVPVSAQDCSPRSRSLHELEAIWSVSKKHIQTESIVDPEEMISAIKMAEIISGGSDKLRERPILSIMQCTISPLAHDRGSLEAAIIAAQNGLPVGFMTMASAGSTGPVTLAGNLVVGNAEVLSALVLMQMAAPGSPFFYAAAQTAVDLRTGAYTGGGPEDFLFGGATNKLADFYNIPLSMGAFATGAKEPDWQAAVDNSLSSFMAVSTMADMLLGAGLLHGSRIFSYEMLLLDSEIWSLLENLFKGINVNESTLALSVIEKIGQGGMYLAHEHTRKHMGERWKPSLMDRRPYETWEVKKDGARQRARERALHILSEHRPLAQPPEIQRELLEIIKAHESKFP